MMAGFPELQSGESILWEGRPVPRLRLTMGSMASGIFGLALFLGCLGIATVVARSVEGLYWTILAPGLILALVIAGAPALIDRRRQTQTRYRITSRGIFAWDGRALAFHQVPTAEALQVSDTSPKTITLGHNRQNRPITLDRLRDADAVFALLQAQARQDHAA